ncbi:MAG TPA: ATP synthase F1 subunit gamma [Polyangiaceae bacterium]|nr:ATP synthase F1 subunit gamma [Polyangiaceae bacterium]
MPNLKSIRKRIGSVKSTQKITRAMKMVAGARLNRAQHRITSMRPYAVTTGRVLREVVLANTAQGAEEHPLLAARPEKRALYIVITSDRGLCGSFNSSINKRAEALWKESQATDTQVQFAVIGRKGRDYLRRRSAPVWHVFDGLWDKLGPSSARAVAHQILRPFLRGEIDAIYLVYNEFKSAITQRVVVEPLLPLQNWLRSEAAAGAEMGSGDFIFEPDRTSLLERLVPMYIEVTLLRALYESMASELGARMTAMDAATKNAKEVIGSLTLKYNRARQAAITTEILEIIGGAEALEQG